MKIPKVNRQVLSDVRQALQQDAIRRLAESHRAEYAGWVLAGRIWNMVPDEALVAAANDPVARMREACRIAKAFERKAHLSPDWEITIQMPLDSDEPQLVCVPSGFVDLVYFEELGPLDEDVLAALAALRRHFGDDWICDFGVLNVGVDDVEASAGVVENAIEDLENGSIAQKEKALAALDDARLFFVENFVYASPEEEQWENEIYDLAGYLRILIHIAYMRKALDEAASLPVKSPWKDIIAPVLDRRPVSTRIFGDNDDTMLAAPGIMLATANEADLLEEELASCFNAGEIFHYRFRADNLDGLIYDLETVARMKLALERISTIMET